MESEIKREGFVSVLWESSDDITDMPFSELTLQRNSSPVGSPRESSGSSLLSLKDKIQILASIGSPDDQDRFNPDMLDHMDASQLRD